MSQGSQPDRNSDEIHKVLVRQNDYFRYLYEQELQRSERIVNGAKVYIALLVFVIGSITLKVVPYDKIRALAETCSVPALGVALGWGLVGASAVVLTASIVLSILVLKVWDYERLCDPSRRLIEMIEMKSEADALSKSISDFVVATGTNFEVNNRRAKCLSLALVCLISGLLLSLLTLAYLNFIG